MRPPCTAAGFHTHLSPLVTAISKSRATASDHNQLCSRRRDVIPSPAALAISPPVIECLAMNERQRAHIDYYLQRLAYWKSRKPASSTARLLAARDADETHPLRTEEEATEVVGYLRQLEQVEDAEKSQ